MFVFYKRNVSDMLSDERFSKMLQSHEKGQKVLT